MTTFIDIPGFAPTAPPESSLTTGHLLLLAPGRSEGWWEDGSSIPNVAAARAAAIVGAPVPSVTVFNTFASGASGQIERTACNAPHFMVSHVSGTNAGTAGLGAGGGLQMPTVLRDYLNANPGHQYYLGVGFKLTRGYTSATPAVYPLVGLRTNLSATVLSAAVNMAGTSAGTPGSSDPLRLGFTTAQSPADAAERFVGITANGFGGSLTSVIAYAGGWSAGTTNVAPSYVVRRLSLVDLTVAGLTHATVVAADRAVWAASLAAAGYYHGDTNTDPAAVP